MKKLLFIFTFLFISCSDSELNVEDDLNEALELATDSCENFLECNDNNFFINYDNSEGKIYVEVIKFSNSDIFVEQWFYVTDIANNLINFEEPGSIGYSNVDHQSINSKWLEDECEEAAYEISRNMEDELSINLLERWPTNSDPFDFYESYRFLKKENGDLILSFFDDQGQTKPSYDFETIYEEMSQLEVEKFINEILAKNYVLEWERDGVIPCTVVGNECSFNSEWAPFETLITTNQDINGREGRLEIVPSGGTGVYSYRWEFIPYNPLSKQREIKITNNSPLLIPRNVSEIPAEIGTTGTYRVYIYEGQIDNNCYSSMNTISIKVGESQNISSNTSSLPENCDEQNIIELLNSYKQIDVGDIGEFTFGNYYKVWDSSEAETEFTEGPFAGIKKYEIIFNEVNEVNGLGKEVYLGFRKDNGDLLYATAWEWEIINDVKSYKNLRRFYAPTYDASDSVLSFETDSLCDLWDKLNQYVQSF